MERQDIRVVPSVVNHFARIMGLIEGDEISLFNSSGICIKKEIANGEEVVLNYANLNAGLYLIKVKDKTVLKTIKQ